MHTSAFHSGFKALGPRQVCVLKESNLRDYEE